MYWNEQQIEEWVNYINLIVGDDSPKGGLFIAEKSNSIEVSMAGEKDELLQILAASVYNFSKTHSMAFEDVMDEISDTWSKMREKNGQMVFGNEIIDMETGIGFNSETEMISFPIPPKEIQEQMLKSIEAKYGKTSKVKERLHSEDDIINFLKECSEVGSFVANEENGEQGIVFVYEGDRFSYFPHAPGTIAYHSDEGVSVDLFEDDDIFRMVILKILNQE